MYNKILQGFHGTHVAERTRTHPGLFIKDCSKLKLIIYSADLILELPGCQT